MIVDRIFKTMEKNAANIVVLHSMLVGMQAVMKENGGKYVFEASKVPILPEASSESPR